MADGGALVNLGDLTKPATILIEKVSDAIGGIARPWQTRRVARAEAEVEVMKAESKIKISELEERALVRMIREEGFRQENIEKITEGAIDKLKQESKPEDLDRDWLSYFFDKGRLISDTDMRSVWSSLLAGQANNPGVFSRKTIDVVSSLDRSDADLFSRFCKFVWMIGVPTALVFNPDFDIYNRSNISFSTLSHLETLGLIRFDNMAGFVRRRLGRCCDVFYYGRPLTVEFLSENLDLEIGNVLLTESGKQLYSICGSVPDFEFQQFVMKRWFDAGYTLSVPINSREFWGGI